ncbi:MAG: histidine phosphatase family protein [Patescibacteria group bacterium]
MYQNPYIKLKPRTQRPYTEIYLIRHCNPNYSLEKKRGPYNMPLSPFGLKQRKYLTKKLLSLDIDKVYSSGLIRAQETAASYIKKTGLTMIIDQRLDEIDWTHWHKIKYFNMSESSRKNKLPSHPQLYKELDKMQITARRALADLFRRNRGHRVLVFSHGNFIKALITGILDADVLGFLSLEIFQSSISKIVIDRDGYVKVSFINDVSHLPLVPKEDLFITLAD